MSEQMMRCDECNDPYHRSDLKLCHDCDSLLCAACACDHDCAEDDDEDDVGAAITYAEYVAAEAKLAEWNARVAEFNAARWGD